MRGQRGFALVVVLWTVAILALLTAHLLSTARQRSREAILLRNNARLEAAADGAVFDTILAILKNNGTAASLRRSVEIGGVQVDIALLDEAGKLNPNTASIETLQNLMMGAGIDQASSTYLARSIVDWRTRVPESLLGGSKLDQYRQAGRIYLPPNQPMVSLDELGLVLGMTPDHLARIKPLLSVVRQEGRTPVAGALDQSDPAAEPGGTQHANTILPGNSVYQVDSVARMREGGLFRRRAVIRIKMVPEKGEQPYEILAWESPDA